MTTLGPRITTTPDLAQTITTTSQQQYAFNTSVLAAPPTAGFLTRMGLMVKALTGTSPRVTMGIWSRGADGGPDVLLARTDPYPVLITMQNYEAPIAWVNRARGSLQTALRVVPGEALIFGVVNVVSGGGGSIQVGLQAGTVERGNWRISNAGGIPSNPFGVPEVGALTTYLYSFYADYTASTAPTLTLTSPVVNATIGTTTPTFEADFTDPDFALGDVLGPYTVLVRNKTTLASLWNSGLLTPSSTEISARHITRLYGGSTLVAGVDYEWTIVAQDGTGLAAPQPAYRTFTIASTALVDVSTGAAPTGKVDGDSAQISFTANWWHTANIGATAVQVQVLDAVGTIIKTGIETPKTIPAAPGPPGTPFTVTPAESGIGTLPYGVGLRWQIRARAANGILSAYSTPIDFRTNAIPSIPVLISPADNAFTTSLPALVIASTDADADDIPLTGVQWTYEITQILTGQIRYLNAQTYNAALGRATCQLTATEVPIEGPYRWRAEARDLSAGPSGGLGYSVYQIFNFGVGPVVTVTAPAVVTVGTVTPRITWTTDDVQTAYRVEIYNVNANGTRGSLVNATAKVISTNKFHDVPPGLLLNNTQYEIVVSSWDDGDFLGTAAARRFTVTFLVLVTLTGVSGSVVAAAHDVEPTTPSLRWDATTYPTIMSPTGQFTAYVVKRWDPAVGRAASEVTLAVITNAAQTTYADYNAPPGMVLQYAVYQRVTRPDSAVLDSPEVLVSGLSVQLTTPIIAAVGDPGALRFPVMWLGTDLSMPMKRRRSTYQTWGAGGVPSVAEAPGAQKLRDFSFTILKDAYGTLDTHLDAIEAVVEAGGPVCWRDRRKRIFMSIVSYNAKRGATVGKIDITMQLEQVAYTEGV